MNRIFARLGAATLMLAAGLTLPACGDGSSTTDTPYSVGGTVVGLPTGSTLKLLNNGGDELSIGQNGPFAFSTQLANGTAYAVTVGTQPDNANCAVAAASASGRMSGSRITTISVTCTATFTLGGTVTGLSSGNTLTLGAVTAGSRTVSADGSFTWPARVETGAAYAVSIATQPAGQTCTIGNGSGTMGNSAVSNVSVRCVYSTQYAYVLNQGSNTISTLAIDGVTLAVAPPLPTFGAQDGPKSIATDSGGKLAVVANNLAKTISVYRINPITGALTALGSPVATSGLHPRAVAMTGNLVFVAVADFVSVNKVLTYRVDAAAPSVTLTDTRDLPGGGGIATSLDVNGQGTTVIAATQGPGTLSVFGINHTTSSLTEVPTSPIYVSASPQAVRLNPAGTLAFVANAVGDNVTVYGVSATGALTEKAGSPYATGGSAPSALAIDATGTYVYVTNAGSNTLSAFALDAASGALTAVVGSPYATGTDPGSVSVDRGTVLVLVSNRTAGTVSMFRVGAAGALAAVSGSPFTVGSEPSEINFGP